MRLVGLLQCDVPELSYLAPTLEQYCSAGPEQMRHLVDEASPAELDRLQQIAERLLQNQASDVYLLRHYLQRARSSDPASADLLEEFLRAILPVAG